MATKIFVVGCPRSGTTLVQELLGAHTDVFTCRETHFFHRVRRDGSKKLLDHLFLSRAKVVDAYDFVSSNIKLIAPHDPNGIRTLRDAALFFDNMMTSEARARDKSVWVEKSPENRLYIPWIRSSIPSAQFVHVLRDGRDVVASLADAAQRFPTRWQRYGDLEMAIRTYNAAVEDSMKYHNQRGHIFVQYEHILQDVEGTRRKLCTALGLSIEGIQSSLADMHQQVVRGDESWKSDYHGAIVSTHLVKFNQIFHDEQKQLIRRRVKSWSPSGLACI